MVGAAVVGGTVVVVVVVDGAAVVGGAVTDTSAAFDADVACTLPAWCDDDEWRRANETSETAASMQSTAAARTRRGSRLDIEERRQA